MAVSRNPYREWQRGRLVGDYRNTDTQVTSLVRQQLSQSEYLRSSNRVNPGPYRNTRVEIAEQADIIPHVFGSEDMWGWQSWTYSTTDNFITSSLASSLLELDGSTVPGSSYRPYNEVGGASYISDDTPPTQSVEIGLELPINIPSYSDNKSSINGIPVDTSNLSSVADDYLMVYKPGTNSFVFRSPYYVLGVSDGDYNSDNLNFGTY